MATDTAFERLQKKLREIFEFDAADLDFGIYRILRVRRAEMEAFLESRLKQVVEDGLEGYTALDKSHVQAELNSLEKRLKEDGVELSSSKRYRELEAQLLAAKDLTQIRNEIYAHLAEFFGRYYQEGDFISQRRYRANTYAIPYEGEEVKLHWANADQYYIKSTEYLTHFRFRTGGSSVVLELAEADADETANNKAAAGKQRYFRLATHKTPTWDDTRQEGTIYFTYKVEDVKKAKADPTEDDAEAKGTKGDKAQALLLDEAEQTLLQQLAGWPCFADLATQRGEPGKQKSELRRQLERYVGRNTRDFFIHKDLDGFLRRELDFYIKNEVIYLDDFSVESYQLNQLYIAKAKVIKQIGQDIIAVLAQLENFQKRLWLKKKFVLQTHWCATLDRIPARLYPHIAANERQRQEWVRLFAIDELKPTPGDLVTPARVGYSEPLTVAFLEQNPHLVLDTAFFDPAFTWELLEALSEAQDLDAQTDGLLIHSENFQALNLLQERYREKVDCVYIDPPYNTAASEILYKNEYKHSSWASLISNRLELSTSLMSSKSVHVGTIDEAEFDLFSRLLDGTFSAENNLGVAAIRINPSGRPSERGLAASHEYAIFHAKANARLNKISHTSDQMKRFNKEDDLGIYEQRNFRREGSNSNREDGIRQWYPFFVDTITLTLRVPEIEWNAGKKDYDILENPSSTEVVIYPITADGQEKNWRWSFENVKADYNQFYAKRIEDRVEIYYKYRPNEDGTTPLTMWVDKEYSATEFGTKFIKHLFGVSPFTYPKSLFAVYDSIKIANNKGDIIILDYFGGSATTAHAVINLNREDGGKRKYILVEMGTYFDTVTKPRVQKVIYSGPSADGKDKLGWRDGKPTTRAGSSHLFKYLRLESYEDTLTNLAETPEASLFSLPALGPAPGDKQKADYAALQADFRLHYALDLQYQAAMLPDALFERPFAACMKVARDNAVQEHRIDLPETFNYLLGLEVRGLRYHRVPTTEEKGSAAPKAPLLAIEGRLPDGRSALVLWRNTDGPEALGNVQLNRWFEQYYDLPRRADFDLIYINGSHTLQNVRQARPDGADEDAAPRFKVQLIEETFERLMFADAPSALEAF